MFGTLAVYNVKHVAELFLVIVIKGVIVTLYFLILEKNTVRKLNLPAKLHTKTPKCFCCFKFYV